MTTPPKKPPSKDAAAKALAVAAAGGKVQVILKPLADKAIVALQDPATRKKILENGQKVVDFVKQQKENKPPKEVADDDGPSLRLFHQRLVRREQRVRAALGVLIDGDAKVADALSPVVDALDGVVKALAVAEALPLMSRRKAHRAIDGVLDGVEDQLLAAGLGLAGPSDPDG